MTELVRADDYIECLIIPLNYESLDIHQFGDLYNKITKFVEDASRDYIWHKDGFKLFKRYHNNQVSLNEEDDLPSHFYGICYYGDNVEDEWFIVYMMRELTKSMHELAVRIEDSDGEFMLIEAADSLPDWINPSNSTNRVFFHKGSLLLLQHNSANADVQLSLKESLNIIRNNTIESLMARREITDDIDKRICDYPNKIKESLHKTTLYTPLGAAILLKEDPSLLSDAIHAFCNRDPIDMKVCRAMKYFPPENRVKISGTFTKCLYAMLLQNNFNADRRTGWNLPLQNSDKYKSHSLGMKLACGFEILISQAKPGESLEQNKAWLAYLEKLKTRNYFQGYLEHSQPYNMLLENAMDYFKNNMQSIKVTPEIGNKAFDILKSTSLDEQYFRDKEPFLPKDDDDSWLCIDPKELENMLETRYGRKDFFNVNDENSAQISGKINDFLEHISGIEGVEFPGQSIERGIERMDISEPPERPKRLKKAAREAAAAKPTSQSRSPSPTRKCNIDFDPDQFSNALKNILDFVIPEDRWSSDSEPGSSDYGTDDDMVADILDLKKKKSGKHDKQLKNYMREMDNELSGTNIGKSFETYVNEDGEVAVDVDKTAVKNITASLMEEAGGSGPAGNILGPMGITKIDPDNSIDNEID